MPLPTALVTGFEPYGGRKHNPSARIAQALDGGRIGGVVVKGVVLPVAIDRLDRALARVLRVRPVAIICLGLAPGEAVIRLERFAANFADFEIPDNQGRRVRARPLDPTEGAGQWSRLPLAAIRRRLLAAGIPARLSMTAGTYLCNAAMYRVLTMTADMAPPPPAGFIHLPLLPEQVAAALGALARASDGAALEPSMSFETQLSAVRIALESTLARDRRIAPGRAK